MPPELKPLLAIVIGLALLHAVLKVRARASLRRARTRIKRSAAEGPRPGGSPEDALAALRRRTPDAE